MSTLLLPYSQQGLTITNTNLQGDDFLNFEGRFKITMKSHGLLRVSRLHKQLVPVRHRISDRRPQIAYVWPKKRKYATM